MAAAFSKAEQFYVEQNPDKTEAELMADLGRPLRSVRNFLKKLREKRKQETPPAAETPPPVAEEPAVKPKEPEPVLEKFAVATHGKSISVSMTKAQSETDDKSSEQPRNEKFFASRLPNSIHKIRPNEPAR
jgi:hypothetical protein